MAVWPTKIESSLINALSKLLLRSLSILSPIAFIYFFFYSTFIRKSAAFRSLHQLILTFHLKFVLIHATYAQNINVTCLHLLAFQWYLLSVPVQEVPISTWGQWEFLAEGDFWLIQWIKNRHYFNIRLRLIERNGIRWLDGYLWVWLDWVAITFW